MWRLTYEGVREDVGCSHPELLTELAPQHLQDACVRIGGRNYRGVPNFRLALVGSRYMIAGGHEFAFYDASGNLQKTCPAEMLIPRYQAEKSEWGMYLLERWHPPEWFYKNGFAGLADDVEYSPMGHATRVVEPVWPDGGYEACWWDANQLFVFPRNVPVDSGVLNLSWAIHAALLAGGLDKSLVRAALKEKEAREREKNTEDAADIWKERGRPDLFLEPAISLAGIKTEDMWQQNKESCASVPGIN